MYIRKKPLFFINETPLHAGAGDGIGLIDKPIQRERHTDFPKIEASGIKGAIREVFERKYGKDNEKLLLSFGPSDAGFEAFQGALGFLDARILLFPVKSAKGVFAWISCPKALERFVRDMQLAFPDIEISLPSDEPGKNECFGPGTCLQEINTQNKKVVILEEFSFEIKERDTVKIKDKKTGEDLLLGDWLIEKGIVDKDSFWAKQLKQGIIILNNGDFTDFVKISTEVITRIRIDSDLGVVQKGALFDEEYLPAESIMYTLVMAAPVFQKPKQKSQKQTETNEIEKDTIEVIVEDFRSADQVISFFQEGSEALKTFQIGANATLGKGFMRTKLLV